MKILIFGLPGSGKTWLAERLQAKLKCAWYNADEIRKMANDWEFSNEARLRQADRMRSIAQLEHSHGRTVICDFICPTETTRNIFNADYTVWMNTIESGRFEDTNAMFVPPKDATYTIDKFMTDDEIAEFAKGLI
jgi:adenylylsulfate kinase